MTASRLARYAEVGAVLDRLGDDDLTARLDAAGIRAAGIGGTSTMIEVGEVPVFVKRIPLTDLERRPEHYRSTANLFGLPAFCQFGVGSPGFGAWRELAAAAMTTSWVLDRTTAAFPLMYHWRVLPGAVPAAAEHADIDRTVEFWGGSTAVRDRLEALATASAGLVLFLEYLPQNLHDWLTRSLDAGGEALDAACALVERDLHTAVATMNGNGLWHFDAHFRNVLTDGRRLYLGDLGLATSPMFDLSAPEREFLARNRTHDRAYAAMALVNWLVTHVCRVSSVGGPLGRNEVIRRCAGPAGRSAVPGDVPPGVAATIVRHAPVAAVLNDFYGQLFDGVFDTEYPVDELR